MLKSMSMHKKDDKGIIKFEFVNPNKLPLALKENWAP